jgi:hypothetical protein
VADGSAGLDEARILPLPVGTRLGGEGLEANFVGIDMARVDTIYAEKPTANSNSERIKQGCFAGTVFTHNQVELRMEGQLAALKALEVLQ